MKRLTSQSNWHGSRLVSPFRKIYIYIYVLIVRFSGSPYQFLSSKFYPSHFFQHWMFMSIMSMIWLWYWWMLLWCFVFNISSSTAWWSPIVQSVYSVVPSLPYHRVLANRMYSLWCCLTGLDIHVCVYVCTFRTSAIIRRISYLPWDNNWTEQTRREIRLSYHLSPTAITRI